jgi:hypothetical protein
MNVGLTRTVLLVAGLSIAGCGDDTSGSDGDGSSDTTSGGDEDTTSGGQTCSHDFGCLGGSCTCSDGPKKDQPCCDPDSGACGNDACNVYCEHCE